VNDPRGLAPAGYHIPSQAEWITLTDCLGGTFSGGGPLKETGLAHWKSPNDGATNSTGFTALAAGTNQPSGNPIGNGVTYYAYFWTTTADGILDAYNVIMAYFGPVIIISSYSKGNNYSVRCIKDSAPLLPTVEICGVKWTTENLDVTTYRDGTPIPEVQDQAIWNNLTTGAWCYYNNDPSNGLIYGKLYNWYAVNDPRGLAPLGYHIPTATEWTTLTSCLGGNAVAGGPLKEAGLAHWATPNTGATNSSGFTALPGGQRVANNSSFIWVGATLNADFWTSTPFTPTNSTNRSLSATSTNVTQWNYDNRNGMSIRLIKD
jgi:uncharacterized protein (TIGR02145 family)